MCAGETRPKLEARTVHGAHGAGVPLRKSLLGVRQHGQCLSACCAVVRQDPSPSCAESAATIATCEPVVLHVSTASTQPGAH